MSDLVFRIAADLGDLKAALADVRRQIAEAGAGGGKAFTPVNQQLDESAAKARIAAREAERLARAQETAAQRAARAQERAAQQAEAAQKRAAARAAAEAERIAKQKERDAQRAAESVQRKETAKQRALVPQLTDITVGLATGQSPLMVLLQQGGQLKDLFGGIGPAVKAVGGAVASVITPVTLLGGAIAALAIGYIKGAAEGERFRRVLIETGSAAGVTAGDLQAMADRIGALSGNTVSSAADALAQVIDSGKFAARQVELVAKAAESARSGAGRDVTTTIAEFGKIADDPVKGVEELNKRYNFLTGTLAEQIRTLQQQGKEQEASTLAMKAYADAVNDRAPKIRENLGLIERALRGIKQLGSEAASGLATIGRDQEGQAAFNAAAARRQELQRRLDSNNLPGVDAERQRASLRAGIEAETKRMQALSDAQIKAQKDAGKKAAQGVAVAEQERMTAEAQAFEKAQTRLDREKAAVIKRSETAIEAAKIAADDKAEQNIAKARDERLAAIAREEAKAPAAFAQANATVVRDDTTRAIEDLQRMYDRGLVNAKDFFAKKRDLQIEAINADIAAQRAELATTQEPADIARIRAQIKVLEKSKADARRDAIRDEARATQALQASLLETETGLQKDALDRQLALLQAHFQDNEVAVAAFYATRIRLQQQAIDAEIALNKKRQQNPDIGPAERAALVAEEEKLQRQRNDIAVIGGIERKRAEKELADQITDIRAQALDNEFKSGEAAGLRIEKQFRDLRQKLVANGNIEGVNLIDKLVDTEKARAKFGELKAEFDRTAADLQTRLQGIENQRSLGLITADQASQQIAAARGEAMGKLGDATTKIKELAAATNDPAIVQGANEIAVALQNIGLQGAQGLDAAIINLRRSMDDLNKSFAQSAVNAGVDAMTQLFTDLASGSKSAGDAIKDFVVNFVKSMAELAARALATYVVLQLLDSVYPGLGQAAAAGMSASKRHSGGAAGHGTKADYPAWMFAGAPRFHSGGMVGLKPGEVPAILQTGEQVLSRDQVAAQGKAGGSGTRIVNVIDPNLVQDYMTSASGERTILNVIERNAGAVRQKLA